jgi:alpha-L-rhamnosidase
MRRTFHREVNVQPSPPSGLTVNWQASWIGRHTPAGARIVREIESDHVAWVDPEHWLGQTVSVAGPVTAVSVDVTGDRAVADLELCTPSGDVLAARTLVGGEVPWDRFSEFLQVDPPLPAGTYLVRVTARQGQVGWRSRLAAPDRADDDGVSPLPVVGSALRDGQHEPGVRCLGVETPPAPNPIFRSVVVVDGEVSQARLFAVGLGYGAFSINCHPVTADVLDPAPTDYDRTVLYRTYDVTRLLKAGENVLTAELGRGFYAARGANTWGWNLAAWHREPVLLAQLEYLDAGGTHHVVGSGPTWQTAAGPITSDLLYTGVRHDASREPYWEPAIPVAAPRGMLRPAQLPGIRRSPAVPPAATTQVGPTTVVDFGTVMAGRVRCRISGEPGAEVVLRYGEQLAADGSVHCENVFIAGESQVDRYLVGPGADPTPWEPEFTYKGFRYVGIDVVGKATVHDVAAIPVHTAVERVGSFACQDETLTWIDQTTARTFLNNLHGIPTDTPSYEKNGWTADAHLATEAVLHHFDLRTSFGKWLDDHVDAQDEQGVVPQIVPTPGWGRALDPAWSASLVLIAWNLYWEYGDRAALERHVEAITAYVDHALEIARVSGWIWPRHSWGDWLSPGHMFAPEGAAPTATMMLGRVAGRAADICRALGRTDQAERYADAAQQIAGAYHRAFFDQDSGTYRHDEVGYRQTMNVLPLAFGAVPDEDVDRVVAGLVRDIEQRTDGHLDCGAIGVKHLLPVLSEHGHDDLARTVATQRTAPGWGVWRQSGATTLRESWDADARSHNHYFLGSVAAWIQQRVGGVRQTAPGWAAFEIRPVVDDRVGWARISHRTVRGDLAVHWHHEDGHWRADVTVPAGATAALHLPGRPATPLPSGAHRLRFPALHSTRRN